MTKRLKRRLFFVVFLPILKRIRLQRVEAFFIKYKIFAERSLRAVGPLTRRPFEAILFELDNLVE